MDADFNTGFCWSVGGRATLWGYRCLAFGLEAQYFRASTTLNSFSDAMGYAYFNSNNQASYSEWQAGLGASYRFVSGCPEVSMVPYLAVKWSGSQFHVPPLTFTIPGIGATNTYTLRDLNNSRLWGYAVGMTATINSSFGVTVEGRWADESAVYVGSQLRF